MYYYYFFYVLFKTFESIEFRWWSEWKAALSVSILEIMILITLEGILSFLFKLNIFSNDTITIIIASIILILNYFIFLHNDKWMPFIDKFDKFPKRKNQIGGVFVWATILIIVAALIFMYYLLSQVYSN